MWHELIEYYPAIMCIRIVLSNTGLPGFADSHTGTGTVAAFVDIEPAGAMAEKLGMDMSDHDMPAESAELRDHY